MASGIYAITNIETGEQYIGATENLDARMLQHKAVLRSHSHYSAALQAAFDAGAPLAWEVLEYAPVEEVFDRELAFIRQYAPAYNKVPPGSTSSQAVAIASKPFERGLLESGRPRKYGPGTRANLTMVWPTSLIQRVDAAAGAAGMTRTEYVIRCLERCLPEETTE